MLSRQIEVTPVHEEGRNTDPSAARSSVAQLRSGDLTSGELRATLQSVVEATSGLFGADGAGVMLIDDEHALHYIGATDGQAAAMEAAQAETGEGPCVDSLINDEIVSTPDLLEDERWPRLTRQIGPVGIRAILGVPLHLGQTAIGSLNVYRFTTGQWLDADRESISIFANLVEELLGTAMLARQQTAIVEQLTGALRNRVTIERAVGIVMASLQLDAVRAFEVLRRSARSDRRRVADLAAEVVEARAFTPDLRTDRENAS